MYWNITNNNTLLFSSRLSHADGWHGCYNRHWWGELPHPEPKDDQRTTGRGAKPSYSIAIAPISHLLGIVNTTRETWPRRWSIIALLVFPGGALALLTLELWWHREHLATGAVSSQVQVSIEFSPGSWDPSIYLVIKTNMAVKTKREAHMT